MKLYVVGESSPDPDKWSCWHEPALVIANGEDHAFSLLGVEKGPICEVPLDKGVVLMQMPEPSMGRDL